MKKIFVDIYLAYNLGDDLFLDVISKKYPEDEFTINYLGDDYNKFISKYNNVKKRKYTIIDKILQKLSIKDTITNYNKIAEQHDALVFIGGSIFRDESYHEDLYKERIEMVSAFKKLNKPVFVLGANFGPYKSLKFLGDYKKFFNICDDICFRDTYSYNLFKYMNNVRLAPDIVFQLNLDKFKIREKRKLVGLSIIDVTHKENLQNYEEEYLISNVKCIELLVSKGYKCFLMSFCEIEGDLKAINKILSFLKEETKRNVKVYNYKGNLEEAIDLIGSFDLFISARFHGNVLAQLLGIPILPVIYSEKTRNMLVDINLDEIMVNMNNLSLLYSEDVLNRSFKNICDINEVKEKSKLQFEKLTLFMKE